MLITIVDVETTGVDSENSQLIEVGCIVFDTDSMSEVMQLSSIIPTTTQNDAVEINRIPNKLLETTKEFLAETANRFLKMVAYLANQSAYIVAHNAEFDRRFLSKCLSIKTPWLCTRYDFKFERGSGGSLINLANALEIPIVNNHRALSDCKLISSIFKKYSSEDFMKMVEYASSDSVEIIADVNYAEKELAKANKFMFNPKSKQWVKRVKVADLEMYKRSLPFYFKVA